ncbi:hypothetical protein C0J52_16744 [Blattella germanica]|nr:hypothetical protein C0J52_16744 [Blattella germanica]
MRHCHYQVHFPPTSFVEVSRLAPLGSLPWELGGRHAVYLSEEHSRLQNCLIRRAELLRRKMDKAKFGIYS